MKRPVFLLGAAGALASAAIPAGAAADTLRLPFMTELTMARLDSATALRSIHARTQDATVVKSFDGLYDAVAASAQAFIGKILDQVKSSHPDPEQWKPQLGDFRKKYGAFNVALRDLRLREAAAAKLRAQTETASDQRSAVTRATLNADAPHYLILAREDYDLGDAAQRGELVTVLETAAASWANSKTLIATATPKPAPTR